jgi:predicted ATPase/DNA-binding SARP family transcriptional activator
MSRLSLSMLGPMQVTLDARAVTAFESNRVRALLAYLVLEPERPHHREELAGLLWPDWPDRTARSNLRYALANLRTAIGDREAVPPFLSISRETLQFNAASDHWLDVRAFLNAIDESKRHDHRDLSECAICAQRLGEAVALYKGELLAGFSLDSAPFEEWLIVRREALHRQILDALYHLGAYHCDRGEHERVIHYAQRQVELEPWSERAHRQWMRALASNGQRGAALRQYEECARILQEELGASPGKETTQLYQSILEQGEAPAPAQIVASPLPQPVARRAQPRPPLPRPATPFVGREKELAEVRALLVRPEVRLLTLTGVGGTGKTRLALQVAAGLATAGTAAGYRDGVYWVALAALRDPALVVPTIAAALGVRESGEMPLLEALKYALRDRERLLVIDNFEQVVEAATAVGELLSAVPRVKVLATSRAPLHVYGEHVYAVPPMEVPQPQAPPSLERLAQADAVLLFLQGAQRAQPGFSLDKENAPAVAEICARLDGLPLAVELAAARVRLLSPETMLAHLDDRLQFLTGGPRDAPARQRTLRATIDWSYDLLDADERTLFARLAVFSGGATLEAVEAVCADSSSSSVAHTDVGRPSSLDLLESLIDQSLLQVSHSTPPRFTMLETVREYAWERLVESDEAEAARDRHAACYVDALEGWGTDLKGARQLDALAEIEAELDNARAAWTWAVERGQVEWLDRALEGLCLFCDWCGRLQDGESACQMAAERLSAMARPSATACRDRLRVLAKLWAFQSDYCRAPGRIALADQLQRQSLSLLEGPELANQDTRTERARLFLAMGRRAHFPEPKKSKQLLEQSLALYDDLDDRWQMAELLQLLGRSAWMASDYAEVSQRLQESLAIYQSLGDRRGVSKASWWFAVIALNRGDHDRAEQLARESLAIREELGDRGGDVSGRWLLALALHLSGRYAEAHALMEEATARAADLGSRFQSGVYIPEYQSKVEMERGLYKQARTLARKALEAAREMRSWRDIGWTLCILGSITLAESAYKEAQRTLQESVIAYRETGKQDELGWALACAGYAARGVGHPAQARRHLCEALRIGAETGTFRALITPLPAIALLLLDEGAPERAVELYALASRYPYVAHSRWFEDVAGREITAAAEALPPDVVARAQERGRARDLWAAVEEILDELGGSPSD